jgi:hypothetical protein
MNAPVIQLMKKPASGIKSTANCNESNTRANMYEVHLIEGLTSFFMAAASQ